MLGILFIYFIGKYFYDLAGEHERHQWGFGILGVATYYISTFCFGIALGIISEVFELYFIHDMNDTLLGLIGLPFGLAAAAILYYMLKNSWENEGRPEV